MTGLRVHQNDETSEEERFGFSLLIDERQIEYSWRSRVEGKSRQAEKTGGRDEERAPQLIYGAQGNINISFVGVLRF